MAAVLVVEDNEAVRQLVVMLLEQKGHKVLCANNGLEGLMVYSSYRARVDLVLTDIDMPQMNGIALATRIRALDPSRKIVFMSGASDDPEGLGSYPLLSKPFRPDELIAAVEGALKAPSESVR
jgi:two-component system, cell cycle sensor histidine kinase and response regulator CckA